MRIMALDIGDVRCGIAVSDPAGRVASPVCVLPAAEVAAHTASFRRVLEDWEPDELLFGLPLTLSGEEGPQAAHVREVAQAVQKSTGLPGAFADERLSSKEAKRELRQMGYDERTMRGKVDMVAAAIFLQAQLDANAASPPASMGER